MPRGKESLVLDAIWRTQLVASFALDGTILDANQLFLDTMGYSLEELKGKHHSIFVPSDYASTPEYREFWRNLSSGTHKVAELRRLGMGGKEVWLQATYSPILDDRGDPISVIKFATNVTEQKQRIVDYASQIEAIRRSQCVVTFSMEGIVLDANDVFLEVMGYTLDEVRGKHHSMFVSAEYAASREYALFWEHLSRSEFQAAEFKRIGKGGKEVWLQATYSPILGGDGKPWKVVKVRRVLASFGTHVLQFASDVTEQKRRLAEVERQKALFLANMSHGTYLTSQPTCQHAFCAVQAICAYPLTHFLSEIRTPMNGIFGMLSLLKDTALDRAGRSYVDTCMRSAESLLAVLNDILLYSKADAGAIQLENLPFNLNDIVEDVLYIVSSSVTTVQDIGTEYRFGQLWLRSLIPRIDVTYFIKLDVPMFLVGDGSRLRQMCVVPSVGD